MIYLSIIDTLLAPLVTDTVLAQLVGAGYTPDPAHQFLTDVPAGARIGSPVELTGKTVADGQLFTAATALFVAIAAGDTVTGVVLYRDSGDEATSQLIGHYERRADTVPLAVETDGGVIEVSWPGGRFLKL